MSAKPAGASLRLYRSLSPALCRAARLAGPFVPKLAQGLAGRQGLMKRLLTAAPQVRHGVWFHVTSVGEYEQARPVIAGIRAEHPQLPVMVTHFSPSGYTFARKRPCADLHDYLPFDHPADMNRLVQAWQPRLLVFVKFDCWPNQVLAADNAGVPVVLLAGSLQPDSARLKPMARPLYRDVFNRFAHLGVCTAEDRTRFVAGLICARLRQLGGRLLILGSTWPPDEKLWLPVLATLLEQYPDVRIILTPHEPETERLAALEAQLRQSGINCQRLSSLMAGPAPGSDYPARVILTDSIGVLAEIYRAGHLAYVGGSFTTGVHNTMEPAVARMPVLFGPMIRNAEEAGLLVRRGAGYVLHKPQDALARVQDLLSQAGELARLGELARQVVLDQRGATQRSLDLIKPYLLD